MVRTSTSRRAEARGPGARPVPRLVRAAGSGSSRGTGQHVEQALRRGRVQDPGRQRAVGGEPGQRDVGAQRLRRHLAQRLQVAGDGVGVGAGDRPGEPGVPQPQRVVERRRQQRRRASGRGSATPATPSSSAAWTTSVTRWLAALASAA